MSPFSAVSPVSATRTLRLSPLTSVRWSGGTAVIVTPSHALISVADDRLLAVLQAFAHPRTTADAARELRGLPPSLLGIYLTALIDHGVLVDAEVCANAAANPTPDGEGVSVLAASIAALSRTIARDARAMAPFLDERCRNDGGVTVAARLEDVRDALLGLAADLQHARPEYLRQQRRALNLPPRDESVKLHLGCGAAHLAGWVNVDYPPADLAIDLSWPLPFDDNSVAFAYLAHVLEHLDYPIEAGALLKEVHRVLTPGGVLRVVVPDIGKCIQAYAAGDEAFFEARAEHWPAASDCHTALEHFLHYAGAGVRAEAFWGHKYGYDFETLSWLLEKSGFERIDRSYFMDSEHAALRVDSASAAAAFRYGAEHYSLFVEATKSPRDTAADAAVDR